MRITPIVSNDIIMRYRKINYSTVIDSFTNEKYKTKSADSLLNKLNKIGIINCNRVNKNINQLLYVVA